MNPFYRILMIAGLAIVALLGAGSALAVSKTYTGVDGKTTITIEVDAGWTEVIDGDKIGIVTPAWVDTHTGAKDGAGPFFVAIKQAACDSKRGGLFVFADQDTSILVFKTFFPHPDQPGFNQIAADICAASGQRKPKADESVL